MIVPFAKMHGAGNDFVIVDAVADSRLARAAEIHASGLCDRRFGIGADGVLLVLPADSRAADFEMVMVNPDGTRAQMCGNGIRCFAKYVIDRGHAHGPDLRVLTGRGVLTARAEMDGPAVEAVEVDMGEPILDPSRIPVDLGPDDRGRVVEREIDVNGAPYRVTCVSMGNPHCVVFVAGDVDAVPLASIGPRFERHPLFPQRVNTEFVQVLGGSEFRMRVWERGAGETLACGTGACAAMVACVLTGKTGPRAVGRLAGGSLTLGWAGSGPVSMLGPAVHVFDGEVDTAHVGRQP